MRHDCTHLGVATNRSVNAACQGCGGSKPTAVWTCELHTFCAPYAEGNVVDDESDVTDCLSCPDYVPDGAYCTWVKESDNTYRCPVCGAKVVTTYPNRCVNRCTPRQPQPEAKEPVQSTQQQPGRLRRLFGR